jgi:hypothetical protein
MGYLVEFAPSSWYSHLATSSSLWCLLLASLRCDDGSDEDLKRVDTYITFPNRQVGCMRRLLQPRSGDGHRRSSDWSCQPYGRCIGLDGIKITIGLFLSHGIVLSVDNYERAATLW